MNTYQFQLRSTFARLQDLYVEMHIRSLRQLLVTRHGMIMCKTVRYKLATVSGCPFLLQGTGTKVTGEWEIKSIRGPNTCEIDDGTDSLTVHINRMPGRAQPPLKNHPTVPTSGLAHMYTHGHTWIGKIVEIRPSHPLPLSMR